jgi:hypothetical protein
MAVNPPRKRSPFRGSPKEALPYSTYADASRAVEVLIDNGNFLPDTKEQFALRMEWLRPRGVGAIDFGDARRVDNVCTLLRDLAAEDSAVFGGMTIAYSSNIGGMNLIDPDSPPTPLGLSHVLAGDLQRQQVIKTTNRRRIPTWRQCGQAWASVGDHDMARLFWNGENEIKSTGFVTELTHVEICRALQARGMMQ